MRAAAIVKSVELCEWVVFLKKMSFVLHKPLARYAKFALQQAIVAANYPLERVCHWNIARPLLPWSRRLHSQVGGGQKCLHVIGKEQCGRPMPLIISHRWPQNLALAFELHSLLTKVLHSASWWKEKMSWTIVAAQVADNWFRLVCVWF